MAVCREKMRNENVGNIIIPSKNLGDIRNILMDINDAEDIEIILGNKKLVILVDNTKIDVRLIEGQFIKYKDILPKDCYTKMIIDRNELLTSIERASLLAKKKVKTT